MNRIVWEELSEKMHVGIAEGSPQFVACSVDGNWFLTYQMSGEKTTIVRCGTLTLGKILAEEVISS